MSNQFRQFTTWTKKDAHLDSHYGPVTYEYWCIKECERLGEEFEVRRNDHSEISLWTSRPVPPIEIEKDLREGKRA